MAIYVCINNNTLTFNKVYCVDTVNGNDSNTGTEINPLKTMTSAINKCAQSGDAILLKGESLEACSYGTKTISVIGDCINFGSKLSNRQHGDSESALANITYYGIYINGPGGDGWAEDLYYINAVFYNCIFYDPSQYSNVYGTYYFYNCLILQTATPYSTTYYTNCGFVSNFVGITSNCMKGVVYDSSWNILSSGWLHGGTGDPNPDGSVANIGLYGGQFSFGISYSPRITSIAVGGILSSPENGWTRLDDGDAIFKYLGSWNRRSDGASYGSYNNTWIESQKIGDSFSFTLVFSKLRIIAYGNVDTSGFIVNIDGVNYGPYKTCYGTIGCILACDITVSAFASHNVQITVVDKAAFPGSQLTRVLFDCIDINTSSFVFYAIKHEDKFYIPNANHFDTVNRCFNEVSKNDLYNFNHDLDFYITDISQFYSSFTINGETIYPFDYLKSTRDMKIIKFVGVRNNFSDGNNYNTGVSNITFKTDFTKLHKATLIKLNDPIRITKNELETKIDITKIDSLRVGIESSSVIYGKDFKQITEDEIAQKGFSYTDLVNTTIPFDNIRYLINYTGNTSVYLIYAYLRKKYKPLNKQLNYLDYKLISKLDDNTLYLKLLNTSLTGNKIMINRFEQDEINYKMLNTLDTF